MIGQHASVFFSNRLSLDWQLRGQNLSGKNRLTDNVSLHGPKMCVCAHLSFRVDISDTLMYVYEMLGAELLSNLYDKLGRLLTNAEQPTSWQVGETYTDKQTKTIFCF